MKIEDNFLDQDALDSLQTLMMGGEFAWHYCDIIDYQDDEDKYQFIHFFYREYNQLSPFIHIVNPILEIIKPVSLILIRTNLLTRTSNIVENEFHYDISSYDDENRKTIFPEKLKQLTTSIFYVNTNNGYTKFEDGSIVESVANRMVSFSANMKHKGTSCTDEKIRVVINFNYFD